MKNFAAIVFVLSILAVSAQETTSFSLASAKKYTLEHHLGIQNATYDVQNAIYQSKETRGIGLPQANLTGSFNNFINLPVQVVDASFINPNALPGETVSFRAGTDFSATGALEVSQLLFNGSYLVGLQVSKLFVEFQRTFVKQSKEDAIFNTIQAYQLCAVAQENLVFIDSLVSVTENLVNKQRVYLELGMMKADDFDQMSYSLLTAKNAKTNAEIQYRNALVFLKLAMNYPMDKELSVSENSDFLLVKSNLSGDGSIEDNLNLEILRTQKELNIYSLKNQKAANLPSLNAYFQHAYNAFRNDFNFFQNKQWFPQTSWGLSLNVPIISGGQRHYKIERAKVEVLKNENSILMYQENLKMREIQAKNEFLGASEKLELQKANIQLAGRIYKNAVIKEQIGTESSILVTQKYNQLIQAQAQFVGAKLEVFNAKLKLEKLYNQILTQN
ncbi:MAG: outer membrane protein [Lentimonas sp.]|jgi:outer membrane protein